MLCIPLVIYTYLLHGYVYCIQPCVLVHIKTISFHAYSCHMTITRNRPMHALIRYSINNTLPLCSNLLVILQEVPTNLPYGVDTPQPYPIETTSSSKLSTSSTTASQPTPDILTALASSGSRHSAKLSMQAHCQLSKPP